MSKRIFIGIICLSLLLVALVSCDDSQIKNSSITTTPFSIEKQADEIPFYKTVKELLIFDPTAYLLSENSSGSIYYISENRTFMDIKGFIIYFISADSKLTDVYFYSSNITVDEYLKINEKLSKYTNKNIELVSSGGIDINDLKIQNKIYADFEIQNAQSSYQIINSKKDVGFNTSLVGKNKSFWGNLVDFSLKKNSKIDPSEKIFSELKINFMGPLRI